MLICNIQGQITVKVDAELYLSLFNDARRVKVPILINNLLKELRKAKE